MGKKKQKVAAELAVIAVETATTLLSSKSIQKSLLGTYADGKTRSVADALNGEFLSPKQKAKMMHAELKGKKKKGGKKKGKKGKKNNIDCFTVE